jgi:hypothetical protein
MAQSGFKWDVEPGLAFGQLVERYTNAIIVSGRRVAHSRAEEAEQWMKDNTPWQDRTGDARRGLSVTVNEAPSVLAELVFSHDPSLDYTVWLEIANGGKYAIIAPAIDVWGARLMQDVQRIVNLGLAAR